MYPAQPGNGLFRDIERKESQVTGYSEILRGRKSEIQRKSQEVAWLIGMAHQDSNLIYPSPPVTMRSSYISGGEKRPSVFLNYLTLGKHCSMIQPRAGHSRQRSRHCDHV